MMDFGHPQRWLQVDHSPRAGAPGLFLDRDGTLIENVPYLSDPDEVRLIDGVAATITAFRGLGYAIVVVTNQSAVARKLCTPAQYQAITARIQALLGEAAADLTYACPFHPDGFGEFAQEHSSRKPAPGMILDAAQRFGLVLAGSVMVGDSLSDIQAGANAGVGRLVHVLTGHGRAERQRVADSMATHGYAVELLTDITELRPCAQLACAR